MERPPLNTFSGARSAALQGRALEASSKDQAVNSSEKYKAVTAWQAVYREFAAENRRVLKQLDISGQQYAVLLEIFCSPEPDGPTVGQLANHLQVGHNTAVQVVNKLCLKGYANRSRREQDKRKAYLNLTPKGRAALSKIVAADHDALRGMQLEFMRTIKAL